MSDPKREAMADTLRRTWVAVVTTSPNVKPWGHMADAALALVRGEMEHERDTSKRTGLYAAAQQEKAFNYLQRAEAAEQQRDNAQSAAAAMAELQTPLLAQLQALQQALHSLAKREHCWCDTSPGPHAPITHTTRCLSVRAALASPPAPASAADPASPESP